MKKLLLIIFALVLALSVCGCSKEEETPVASNVQEWFELNKKAIDAYCKDFSTDTDTVVLSAEDNTFIFSLYCKTLTEEERQEAQQGAVNDQEKWNAKPAQEKQEYLDNYVKTLEGNGFGGMPVPEMLVTRVYDENNELVASTYFGK